MKMKIRVAVTYVLSCAVFFFVAANDVSAIPPPPIELALKAAEEGYPDWQFYVGQSYYGGHFGLSRDYAKALSWFQKAADQGHTEAKFYAGLAALLSADGNTEKFFEPAKTGLINLGKDKFLYVLHSYEDEDGFCFTKAITIIDAKTGKPIQMLVTSEFNDGYDAQVISKKALELIVEDMNFDGLDDIRIVASTPAGANVPYICWLWDKGKKQFVHDAVLSEITSLEIDKDNELIRSYIRNGYASYRGEFYRWVDGNLTLIKAVDEEYLDGGETKEVVTWELKEGKLVETGRKIEKVK